MTHSVSSHHPPAFSNPFRSEDRVDVDLHASSIRGRGGGGGGGAGVQKEGPSRRTTSDVGPASDGTSPPLPPSPEKQEEMWLRGMLDELQRLGWRPEGATVDSARASSNLPSEARSHSGHHHHHHHHHRQHQNHPARSDSSSSSNSSGSSASSSGDPPITPIGPSLASASRSSPTKKKDEEEVEDYPTPVPIPHSTSHRKHDPSKPSTSAARHHKSPEPIIFMSLPSRSSLPPPQPHPEPVHAISRKQHKKLLDQTGAGPPRSRRPSLDAGLVGSGGLGIVTEEAEPEGEEEEGEGC